MIFNTANSTYETNPDDRLIRRLQGINDPTPRQGPDGQWQTYETITPPTIGESVLIIWYTETEHKPGLLNGEPADDVYGLARGTYTSPVEIIAE